MTKFEKLLLALSILCILDTAVVLLLKGGTNLGNILPLIAGSLLFLYVLFRRTRLYKVRKSSVRIAERFIAIAFTVWFISFAVVVSILLAASMPDKSEDADCILLLGTGLHGAEPSLVLVERMDLALDYIGTHQNLKIIVSGGQGPGESITEAEAMEKYLVGHGVPGESILKEENSTSTLENMIFSRNAFFENYGYNLKKAVVVTSDFHMFRAKLLARRAGITPYGISSKTPFYILPNVYLREYFALIKSLALDKATLN